MKRAGLGVGLVAALGLALSACGGEGGGDQNTAAPAVRVDGSSTVGPVSEAVAEAFIAEYRTQVTVGESGTGGGIAKFCRGELDVVGASRPISTEEVDACAAAGVRFVEAPIVFDGLTVVVHPSNPISSMTVDQLRRIWRPSAEAGAAEAVTNWRQVDPSFPDMPIQLFGAGTASGTFDFFTRAIMGEGGASRTDYTPSEDDNITVVGVANSEGAMGYFGYAYYEQNKDKLKALAIDTGEGPVAPTPETVATGAYQPLSRPMFIYINADSIARPAVRQFALFYLSHVAEEATRFGYVPLPEASYQVYADRITGGLTGTAFNGEMPVGLTIDELKALPLMNEAPAAP